MYKYSFEVSNAITTCNDCPCVRIYGYHDAYERPNLYCDLLSKEVANRGPQPSNCPLCIE